jgi:repressor LexA
VDNEAQSFLLLQYIRDFLEDNGYPPSYREMQDAIGVSSTRSVSRLLGELRAEGRVDWTPGKRRTLRLLM